MTSVIEQWPGCHVIGANSAVDSYNYCMKDETRVEGPVSFGVPPARRNKRGEVAAFNQELITYGPVRAVEEGLIRIDKFKTVVHSL